jgi:hypothetical protein
MGYEGYEFSCFVISQMIKANSLLREGGAYLKV